MYDIGFSKNLLIYIDKIESVNIDENSAYKFLNHMFLDINLYKSQAKELMNNNREKFTLNKMTKKLDDIMEKYTKELPSQVSIKLPKLKKMKETK